MVTLQIKSLRLVEVVFGVTIAAGVVLTDGLGDGVKEIIFAATGEASVFVGDGFGVVIALLFPGLA
jgi:hypothetical protein